MEHIIRVWPNLADLAKDLGLPYPTVAAWKHRGRLPASYDLMVIEAARIRGSAISLEDLAEARSKSLKTAEAI